MRKLFCRLRHIMGTAKGIDLCVSFNQPVSVFVHELKQLFGAQTLS
jgi:hypothetical protein